MYDLLDIHVCCEIVQHLQREWCDVCDHIDVIVLLLAIAVC